MTQDITTVNARTLACLLLWEVRTALRRVRNMREDEVVPDVAGDRLERPLASAEQAAIELVRLTDDMRPEDDGPNGLANAVLRRQVTALVWLCNCLWTDRRNVASAGRSSAQDVESIVSAIADCGFDRDRLAVAGLCAKTVREVCEVSTERSRVTDATIAAVRHIAIDRAVADHRDHRNCDDHELRGAAVECAVGVDAVDCWVETYLVARTALARSGDLT